MDTLGENPIVEKAGQEAEKLTHAYGLLGEVASVYVNYLHSYDMNRQISVSVQSFSIIIYYAT